MIVLCACADISGCSSRHRRNTSFLLFLNETVSNITVGEMSKSRELKKLLDPIYDAHQQMYVTRAKVTLDLQSLHGKSGYTLLTDLFMYTKLSIIFVFSYTLIT